MRRGFCPTGFTVSLMPPDSQIPPGRSPISTGNVGVGIRVASLDSSPSKFHQEKFVFRELRGSCEAVDNSDGGFSSLSMA